MRYIRALKKLNNQEGFGYKEMLRNEVERVKKILPPGQGLLIGQYDDLLRVLPQHARATAIVGGYTPEGLPIAAARHAVGEADIEKSVREYAEQFGLSADTLAALVKLEKAEAKKLGTTDTLVILGPGGELLDIYYNDMAKLAEESLKQPWQETLEKPEGEEGALLPAEKTAFFEFLRKQTGAAIDTRDKNQVDAMLRFLLEESKDYAEFKNVLEQLGIPLKNLYDLENSAKLIEILNAIISAMEGEVKKPAGERTGSLTVSLERKTVKMPTSQAFGAIMALSASA